MAATAQVTTKTSGGGSGVAARDAETTGPSRRSAAETREIERCMLAALMDERLHGQEDAIYFVLRGLGMPVTVSAGIPVSPCIAVPAAQMPSLFCALRRMGIRPNGKTITLAPHASGGHFVGHSKPSSAPRLESEGRSPVQHASLHSTDAAGRTGLASSDMLSGAGKASMGKQAYGAQPTVAVTTIQQGACFERLAQPKHACNKYPFMAALIEATSSLCPDRTAEVASPPRPVEKLHLSSDRSARRTQHVAAGELQAADSRSQSPHSWREAHSGTNRNEPSQVWLPPPQRANPLSQRSYIDALSKPLTRRLVAHSKSSPHLSGSTAFGHAAHRDLSMRIAKLRASETAKKMLSRGLMVSDAIDPSGGEDIVLSVSSGMVVDVFDVSGDALSRALYKETLAQGLLFGAGSSCGGGGGGGGCSGGGGGGDGGGGGGVDGGSGVFERPVAHSVKDQCRIAQRSNVVASAEGAPLTNQRGLIGWQLAQVTGGGTLACKTAPLRLS